MWTLFMKRVPAALRSSKVFLRRKQVTLMIKPKEPLLVTPLGIAMNCRLQ